MTTVIVIGGKDGHVVSDTQITGDTVVRAKKTVRLANGGLATGAGDWDDIYKALTWQATPIGDPPEFDGSCVLMLMPDGVIWVATGSFPGFPIMGKFAAAGSGEMAAMAALSLGHTSMEAIRVAAKVSTGTSGPYHIDYLNPIKKQ